MPVLIFLLLFTALFSSLAHARNYLDIVSGSGFYVSNQHIVTNQHVVKSCKEIRVRGAMTPGHGVKIAEDSASDLALLTTQAKPSRIALLRSGGSIYPGERVMIMGYPGGAGYRGNHSFKRAVVTGMDRSAGSMERIEFTDTAKKGHSGGPLIDKNGYVIGVVAGRMSLFRGYAGYEEGGEYIRSTSIAIALNQLKAFLKANQVPYAEDTRNIPYHPEWLEQQLKQFVVNVHCIKKLIKSKKPTIALLSNK